MNHIEVAEQIARDASCAQGEFNQRVLAIIPYLTEYSDEIRRLRVAARKFLDEQTDENAEALRAVIGRGK
jgi:hypothetical protein